MDNTNFAASLKRWAYFLVGGGLNTALTFAIYLLLNLIVSYQVAYGIAYACGIVFSYFFNSKLVFKVIQSWKTFLLYPLVYIIQYFIAAMLLSVLVEKLRINEKVAPLAIVILLIPVTYILSKLVLQAGSTPVTPSNRKNHDN